MARRDFEVIARECPRDEDGALTKYAWPGGYEVLYIYEDGGTLCADCARQLERDYVDNIGPDRAASDGPVWEDARYVYPRVGGYYVPGADCDYEDEGENCDNCGRVIYGPADEDNEAKG